MGSTTPARCPTQQHDAEIEKFQAQQLRRERRYRNSYIGVKEKQPLLPMSTRISLAPGGNNSRVRRSLAVALVGALCFAILVLHRLRELHSQRPLSFPTSESATGFSNDLRVWQFDKPDDVKVIGLVFFGRKSRVELLRCYIERNLVDHGGWLDEVHWVKNTDNSEDLKYLEAILASSPRYKTVELEGVGFVGYGQAWGKLERGSLYVKIDDDVVWFDDDTIPRIVSMKLAHPEYLLVSANMINSPLMGWVHYHMGALHPYLPEIADFEPDIFHRSQPSRKPWAHWLYPYWTGPTDYFFGINQEPPYDGHRWLRLRNDTDMHRTPASEIEYATWGTGLKSWAIAAQEHYSFLENLAEGNLDLCRMGVGSSDPNGGKPWFTVDKRLSINFIAIWADDVLNNLPMDTVDEEWLTVNLPKKLQRQIAVNTDALAVHFTFGTQGNVEKTDLLARYHDYALNEKCARRI
ncbi:hypothetical protein PV04_06034 [Phialophora macrospora]|uniref:Uncharacterized protein n=1 Tax=Phialophora macrospora TaxID=1851006 RepID=A0A0D2G3T6_9EURO|nr:hypothetical protein PV04_06034 [Phialophora macrospora]